ncbi:MAG: ParB N-terminal domain-containing protein [Desulfobulbaceae bacterium]|nr:ParB N-terminal domain-containing protein [Desulfobulbaceae bacterium]
MPCPIRVTRVSFQHIDFSDNRFSLVPWEDSTVPDLLAESIKRAGLIHPPILKEKSVNSFVVAAGQKRFQAIKQVSDVKACDCMVIPMETPDIEVMAIALEDNACDRTLTPVERALFFQKILKWLDKKQAAERFLKVLGFEPHPHHIRCFLALLDLEEPLLRAVHKGRLNETVAIELGKMSFSDRLTLFDIIDHLRMSVGNQKKIIATCRDLAARDNIPIMAVLSDPEAKRIIDHPGTNPPQKCTNLMTWLNRKCFPRLSEAEKEFRRFAGSLGLPKETTLSHAPSFEKDSVTLSVTFGNREKLLKAWPKIKSAL